MDWFVFVAIAALLFSTYLGIGLWVDFLRLRKISKLLDWAGWYISKTYYGPRYDVTDEELAASISLEIEQVNSLHRETTWLHHMDNPLLWPKYVYLMKRGFKDE